MSKCSLLAGATETDGEITDLDLYGDLVVNVSEQLSYDEVQCSRFDLPENSSG